MLSRGLQINGVRQARFIILVRVGNRMCHFLFLSDRDNSHISHGIKWSLRACQYLVFMLSYSRRHSGARILDWYCMNSWIPSNSLVLSVQPILIAPPNLASPPPTILEHVNTSLILCILYFLHFNHSYCRTTFHTEAMMFNTNLTISFSDCLFFRKTSIGGVKTWISVSSFKKSIW